ncbi:MAG TPA: nucleoside deaminase [Amaricoccus sp.]|uniref:nucleoside deaminase n=1 Tax=Amaricoccus sp. TaxID=1872485 RepID=UPI001DB9B20A|nr:nucleoside deaminase [Amaricoccus sp.]MCB1372146.1 nucleoside deaminase [Paracoccaceae bacterium]MCC0068161.1 nucleoside deaminase [Rhodovulum sp.]MCB1374481.1 nucleoside deaminase [Paracoccaceae bacterium]MCB1401629.1 nucleoside deaminase [Paracoccaceae bacterium]HPG21246.1 nucleoside deaminase [Amaricoccus sp.]
MYDDKFMLRAIEISARALEEPGTEPFGAVVVRDGRIVGEGINRSLQNFDPTSHGETEAIRDACRNLQSVDLRGCDLYTSCEPCALCVAAMEIAGIARLYYAANLAQSNAALEQLPQEQRFPIDCDHVRRESGRSLEERSMPSEQAHAAEAIRILTDWAERARRRAAAAGRAT